MPRMTEPELTRFLTKCEETQGSCWLWTGALDYQGYGMVRFQGKVKRAHLVSFMHFCEEIPEGMKIMHDCDEPSCVNPMHLTLGTQKENVHDMLAKGRRTQNKLTESDVEDIRKMIDEGYKQSEIAREFGIDQSHVSRIKYGYQWRQS